ncbi:hypothetical protein, unknown function [Leishmania tarentolae]|uniref:Uncharacterized protein n=1 Tax=Leishmania tarentolae TaxID=5689 RepID=A0A640KCZ4_LEITA|nr:hypothetical protein, unknown function [Leishmania tarentolae]
METIGETFSAPDKATLPELARECYSLLAELIIGKAAAADIGGYRTVHYPRWWEQCSIVAGPVAEAEQRSPQQHQRSPAEYLISQLARLCPLLRPSAREGNLCGDAGAITQTENVLTPLPLSNVSAGIVERSSSLKPGTATSPPNLWDGVADALYAFSDALDMCVDSTTVPLTFSASAPSLPAAALGGQSLSQIAAALTEESCIMAGLLLHREVRPRSGPCYATVVSPVLVVLDLDGTLLRSPLSTISLRAAQEVTAAEVRALFVDADFLHAFCEAVARHGHELAICSLTEGTADQWATSLSAAEAVLYLLSRVLLPTRTYLTSTDDVLCLPRSVAGPGKLYHLQELQQRRNARDEEQRLLRGRLHAQQQAQRTENRCGATAEDTNDCVPTGPSSVPPQAPCVYRDGIVGGRRNPLSLLLPKWLSTDVVLIDDDKENCRMAVTQGYHATSCAETGMSASWYAANPELQVLLGIPAIEVVSHNGTRSRRTSL